VGFKPTISAGERPQTALDHAATGTGWFVCLVTHKTGQYNLISGRCEEFTKKDKISARLRCGNSYSAFGCLVWKNQEQLVTSRIQEGILYQIWGSGKYIDEDLSFLVKHAV
jgi:hypothetical protein